METPNSSGVESLRANAILATYTSMRLPPKLPFQFDGPELRSSDLRDAFISAFGAVESSSGAPTWDVRPIGNPATFGSYPGHDIYEGVVPHLDAQHFRGFLPASQLPLNGYESGRCTGELASVLALWKTEPLWDPLLIGHTAEGAKSRVGARLGKNSYVNDLVISEVQHESDRKLTPSEMCSEIEETIQSVAQYLSLILGQRRSYLFTPALACRIFNVTLPAGLMIASGTLGGGARLASENPLRRGFIVVPVVTLICSPRGSRMRRTATVANYFIPVKLDRLNGPNEHRHQPCGLALRDLESDEAAEMSASWDLSPSRARISREERVLETYEVFGGLARYGSVGTTPWSSDWTARRVLERILQLTMMCVTSGRAAIADARKSRSQSDHIQGVRAQINDEILRCLSLSKASLIFAWDTQTNVEDREDTWAHQMAGFLVSGDAAEMPRPEIDQLHTSKVLIPEGAYVDSYFVAPHSCLVYEYRSKAGRTAQKRSALFNIGYITYYLISLSAIRETVLALHHEVESVDTDIEIAYAAASRIAEVEEVFDLDLGVRPQKRFYEELLRIDGVTSDFNNLREKLGVLTNESILRYQARQSRSLRVLTIIIAVAAIFSSVGILLPRHLVVPLLDFHSTHSAATLVLFGFLSVGALGWIVVLWRRERT